MLAMLGVADELVSDGSLERPMAIEQTPPHTVSGLFPILLPLMLRYRCQQVFDQLAIAVLTKFDGRGFQPAARLGDVSA
ncbi:MAG: hypothetical protein LKF30_05665 [Sphingobium sp.]|nr:hypothetical protein [Sphingobium sp.]MCI1757332.1 hypothetical protein [Sphingobium sp.]MCI2053164.1 hypothetical protein [Sphingobium sp.]